ncbi:MAG TPA: radical SAM protein [Planctomycetaceae bacterium]|nr:radical SAM protein [Planctomycetaceae bacterium]
MAEGIMSMLSGWIERLRSMVPGGQLPESTMESTPRTPHPRILTVDIVGMCNLRCPSCPVGNMGPVNPSGLMSEELFHRIVEKAVTDFGIESVVLFNWTESLLHPRVARFVQHVKSLGLYCMLSSNLNVLNDADAIMEAHPDHFRISLSGFTQEVYGKTHRQGNIERVKQNMRMLSTARQRAGAHQTRVVVYYHKYRHNLHEVAPMREFSHQLGFEFSDAWAYYMPLEKLLRLLDGQLPPEERRFVEDEFALPIVESIAAARELGPDHRCNLLDDQLVIDVHGNLAICCTVFDLRDGPNRLGSFLEMSSEDISRSKRDHATCAKCTAHNIHLHYSYYDLPELQQKYDDLATRNLGRPEGD